VTLFHLIAVIDKPASHCNHSASFSCLRFMPNNHPESSKLLETFD
jgi:hypothetical protein